MTFYRQIVAELRKVVYPTREQLVTYFFVVLAFVLVMIAIVSLLDLGLGKLAFEIFTGADDI
nr:preprotein translocase subunit SecE [Nocardioides sp. WS12]